MTREDHDSEEHEPLPTAAAASDEEDKPARTGRVVYRQLGLFGSLGASVCIDFDRNVLSHGSSEIPFSQLRTVEVRVGIFGASDGHRWIWFDTQDFSDGNGPLGLPGGTLSPTFAVDCDDLRLAVRVATAGNAGDS